MKEILDRLDKIDARFDRVDGQLNGIVGRLDGLDGRLDGQDGRFDGMDLQLRKQGVLLESIGADLKQTMEGVAGNRLVMDQEFAALRKQIDERVQPLEWASRHFSKQLAVPGVVKRRRKTR
jgi:hypothetical protein